MISAFVGQLSVVRERRDQEIAPAEELFSGQSKLTKYVVLK